MLLSPAGQHCHDGRHHRAEHGRVRLRGLDTGENPSGVGAGPVDAAAAADGGGDVARRNIVVGVLLLLPPRACLPIFLFTTATRLKSWRWELLLLALLAQDLLLLWGLLPPLLGLREFLLGAAPPLRALPLPFPPATRG